MEDADPGAVFVTVRAVLPTMPLPPNSERPSVSTERLILRPVNAEDIASLHVLRTQPEVMRWTALGKVDRDIDQTRERLARFLPPGDTKSFNWAICLRSTGEFIGIGGCHSYPGGHGWPEVGYMIRDEFKGRGYTTEFLQAWLGLWAQLPRSEREIKVQKRMLSGEGGSHPPEEGQVMTERLVAITVPKNTGSRRVLQKCGFEHFLDWREPDLGDPTRLADLLAFQFPPSEANVVEANGERN